MTSDPHVYARRDDDGTWWWVCGETRCADLPWIAPLTGSRYPTQPDALAGALEHTSRAAHARALRDQAGTR